MNGGQQHVETYEQRRARESAEREQQHVAQVQRQAARIREHRLLSLDKGIERLEPWVTRLTEVRAEFVEQLAALPVEAEDPDTRMKARGRAVDLADAIDCIDRGPRNFGPGMLDVPREVEDGLAARGVQPKEGLVSRSRFAGRTGLRKASRVLEELRQERGKLTAT